MAELFIPTLHTFAMKNSFTGSCGAFRFRIVPDVIMKTPKEVDMEASSIRAEFWHGPFCYEKSQIEGNMAVIRQDLELPDECPVIPFSAEKGDGRQELLDLILHHMGDME